MLKLLKKHNQAGFTIVELLIVIVVIGILAAIVLNTFSGVQARARNTERQTDIKSLSSQLEAFAADPSNPRPGEYLAQSVMTSTTTSTITASLKGLDVNALVAPGSTASNSIGTSLTPATTAYGYAAYVGATGTTLCVTTPTPTACNRYVLAWTEEGINGGSDTTKTKNSLN